MIISCIKCQKKFSVDDKLIPELGRILECGSCSYQWHYIPILVINKNTDTNKTEDIIKKDELSIFDKNPNENNLNNKKIIPDDDNNKKIIPNLNDNNNDNKKIIPSLKNNDDLVVKNKQKKSKFLNILLVCIITFVSLIIILDTFRDKLSNIFPNLDLYLYSLYNTFTDIFLFITNLIR